MERVVYYIVVFVSISLLDGCRPAAHDQQKNIPAEAEFVDCEITDSCTSFAPGTVKTYFVLSDEGERLRLFSIVEGGSIEYLTDTIESIGPMRIASFTIADYSQENQIFYVLYNTAEDSVFQSGRVNLSDMGLDIRDYGAVEIDSISSDSIYLKGKGSRTMSVEALPLDCDSNRIINYYEYE